MKKLLLVLVAVLALTLAGCQKTQEGSKCVTIEVVYEAEEIEETLEVCTDAEYMAELLEENEEALEAEISEAGFLDGLKGYNFNELDIKFYWAIFINDDYGMLGVNEQPVADGDVYKFEATGW